MSSQKQAQSDEFTNRTHRERFVSRCSALPIKRIWTVAVQDEE
ncbi:hypothetical protein [Methylomonas fluvii]|nr:hypothetical protein [Methylomonas fluvii]